MMTRYPQLVNAILAAGRAGSDEVSLHAATAAIRQSLLAFGSETPDNIDCAQRIDFGPSVARRFGPDRKVGLRIAGSHTPLSNVLWELEGVGVPKQVREAFPNLTEADIEGGMRFAVLLLASLECDG